MTEHDDPNKFDAAERFRPSTVREFVRRFRRGVVNRDKRYIWFLGAGCSASSGVPTADVAVRAWLKELKFLETGRHSDLDAWAAKRFVGYDPAHPGRIYAAVLLELCQTDRELRKVIDDMVASAEAGFGYAILAQLMTHQNWGERTHLAITTNFDDLAADAMHLFSQKRPNLLTNESINHLTPFNKDAPTIVKIYGDAHLPREGRRGNRPSLNEMTKTRLGEQMADASIIFVGYGGRDESVLELIENLPVGSPTGGINWINQEPPSGAFGAELEKRGAVWVQHNDFDELMFFVRAEFGLGHPPMEKFERILNNYFAKYREISTRNGLDIDGDDDAAEAIGVDKPKPSLLGGAAASQEKDDAAGVNFRALGVGRGGRRDTEKSRHERMKKAMVAVKKVLNDGGASRDVTAEGEPTDAAPSSSPESVVDELLDAAVADLHGGRPGVEAPGRERPELIARDEPRRRRVDSASAEDIGSADAGAGEGRVGDVVRRMAESSELSIPRREDVLSTGSRGAMTPDAGALPPEPIHRLPESEFEVGERALSAAITDAPQDAALRARRARYLTVAAGAIDEAEAEYEKAHQLQPKSVAVLREYAEFALSRLGDHPRAERLLTRALNLDLRNAETLLALAGFLLRARGDLEEAENCLRLAVEVASENPRTYVAYAHFLDKRRGRRDSAEAQLRRAAELRPPSARALAELALFRAERMSLNAAEQAVCEAERLAPDAPETFFARAALLERRGDVDAAERHFRRAVDSAPADVRIRLAYARFLEMRRGALDAAERQYRNAIAVAPHAAEPMSAYGRFLRVSRGDAARATPFFQRAIDTEPFDPFVLTAYAEHVATRQGMLDEADTFFRDALELAPGSAEIRRAYGRFLAAVRRDPDRAEAQYRAAIEIDPHSADALDELAGFLHAIRDDAEEAEVYFREALRVAPDRSETLHRFAAFLRDTRDDLEEAERYYRKAVDSNPNDARTLARAAGFLLAQGRRQEGLKVLHDCFHSIWRVEPEARPSALMLQLWIYSYAHDFTRLDEAYDAAEGLILAGVRCDGWDFEAVVEEAIRARHPDPQRLRDLVAVAAEGADPRILRRG